jgi:hypothetical protein
MQFNELLEMSVYDRLGLVKRRFMDIFVESHRETRRKRLVEQFVCIDETTSSHNRIYPSCNVVVAWTEPPRMADFWPFFDKNGLFPMRSGRIMDFSNRPGCEMCTDMADCIRTVGLHVDRLISLVKRHIES